MDDTQNTDEIGYAERAQGALLDMVRDVIAQIAETGLPGAHHFYITFLTEADGVVMPDALRANHPEDLTIVIQNQYENLEVDEDAFSVRLFFEGKPNDLVIPFAAITRFYDPSVSFGLVFETLEIAADDETLEEGASDSLKEESFGEVISLDSFRK